MSNLANDQAGIRGQIGGDTHIDHDDTRVRLTGENVDGCAAVQEVQHHLRRNVLRVCADALFHHAVIAGHYQHGLVAQAGQCIAGHPGERGWKAPRAARGCRAAW